MSLRTLAYYCINLPPPVMTQTYPLTSNNLLACKSLVCAILMVMEKELETMENDVNG
jgi:hypothetical protein